MERLRAAARLLPRRSTNIQMFSPPSCHGGPTHHSAANADPMPSRPSFALWLLSWPCCGDKGVVMRSSDCWDGSPFEFMGLVSSSSRPNRRTHVCFSEFAMAEILGCNDKVYQLGPFGFRARFGFSLAEFNVVLHPDETPARFSQATQLTTLPSCVLMSLRTHCSDVR